MQRTYPAPTPPRPVSTKSRAKAARFVPSNIATWLLLGSGLAIFLLSVTLSALFVGALVIYAWQVAPEQLGLTLDANATAIDAQHHGRRDGAVLTAMLTDSIVPTVTLDRSVAKQGIQKLAQMVDSPAQNATVRIVDGGRVVAVPAAEGRLLDVQATLNNLSAAPGSELTNGVLNLVMVTTKPTVTDASGLIDKARKLLASPLTLNAFDPIQDQTTTWSVPVQTWGAWLTTDQSASGVNLNVDSAPLTNYLAQQNQAYSNGRYIDVSKSVGAVRASVSAGNPTATLQVYHKPTQYTVTYGDTIGTIAWAHGIPMWRIARANPALNMDALSSGQQITIPSQDDMLPLPVVPNKRIVISISKQHMWVYENGTMKWDWIASTGIADSPTAPGVFQVQGHEVNAYAGNWNLWMPHFMDIYEAVPDFFNGIHGFPTRNGQGLLWQGDLGHPVTFGCILVSSANAEALYNWAPDGVVVEIQR